MLSGSARRLVRKIAQHRGKRDEYLLHIAPVVAGILLLEPPSRRQLCREVSMWIVSPTALREPNSCFFESVAKHCDAPALSLVFPVVESTFSDVDAANLLERGAGNP